MKDSSTSTSPDDASGASTTASPSPVTGDDSTAGTAASIPDSDLSGGDHDGMVSLDDGIDDPTLAYRAQIVAVVARIDEALPGTNTRDLIAATEVQDLLLDLRSLLA